MKVSVIIPTYQEIRYISRCLNSLLESDFDFVASESEVFVVDGGSTDGTREAVKNHIERYPFVRLLDNPNVLQVFALNIGIKEARGDLIIRCDAHSEYPRNYVSELAAWHAKDIAANIGGRWITLPGSENIAAKAIAAVMSHPLGVGFTYRTIDDDKERFVDTVPFGSWKRETIEKVGAFDEEFIRTQDFEHNVRIRAYGLKVLMLPWLRIKYYARENFRKSWCMFFQYGYWKNKVNKKYRTVASLRQLVPPLFVLGLILLLIGSFFSRILAYALGIYSLLYLIPVAATSFMMTLRRNDGLFQKAGFFFLAIFAFFTTHVSYGLGYLLGFIDIIILNRKTTAHSLKTHTR